MSRVIKKSDLHLTEPRLLSIETTGEVDLNTSNKESSQTNSILLNSNEDINELRTETDKIIMETEQMVLDLLNKARGEARETLNVAQDEAELIRSKALEEAHEITEQARQSGYEEGLRQAQEAIEADRQLALIQSQEIIQEANRIKMAMFESSESDMVRLSLAIAKRIIATELQTNPDIIVNILREALTYLNQPDNITLFVNPTDIDTILDAVENINLLDGQNDLHIEVKADGQILPGGLKIESESGSVDARIETRVASIENAVQEVLTDE
ncbi:MAG: FliH/SctL family protein [Syntrophomonadaceae bacterium]|nr:FliH/SctL family protein [Syntrophomonadaceae bacterium]